MGYRHRSSILTGALLGVLLSAGVTAGQDLEPRAFSPAPAGLNFVALVYGISAGNIFFDPVLPIDGAEGTVQSATLGYVRTLGLFGKSAKLSAFAPYAWGRWDGVVAGEYRDRVADGFADPGVQLSVNFVGAPAMTLREMATYDEGVIVGASLLVKAPLGQYDPDRLINLGTNRWTFVPRLGSSVRVNRWTLEAIVSASFYTDNTDAYQDTELSQDPLWGGVLDAIYQFKRGMWLGFGIGVGAGARTIIDGVPKDTYQQNKRLGGVFAYPLSRRSSLKLTYVHSFGIERGADFDTFNLGYQMRWGGGL